MAALRFFARSAIAGVRSTRLTGDSWKNTFPLVDQQQRRWATIKLGVGQKEKEIELPDFEVTRDPKEWSYVESVLPVKVIPKAPTDTSKAYPSGWKPQSYEAKELPYFVERTKNHMLPVYIRRYVRGIKRRTHIRRIQGDIMLLEKELRSYIEQKIQKKIGSQVNEPAGTIKLRGDLVHLCREFLDGKGF